MSQMLKLGAGNEADDGFTRETKNCILSHSRNTHRFDQWMIKFLIAHAMELEDKVDDFGPDTEMSQASSGAALLERSRVIISIT